LGRDYTRQQLFYIGDFGNVSETENLHILRIEKNSVEGNIQKLIPFHSRIPIRLISKLKSNTTNFDCEAFVVVDDSIYLFTKQWKQKEHQYIPS
jgi:hypothetical protein